MLHEIFWNKVFIDDCLVFTQDKIPSLKGFSSFCIYSFSFYYLFADFMFWCWWYGHFYHCNCVQYCYDFCNLMNFSWNNLPKFTTFISKSSPKLKLCTIKMPNMFSRATFGRTNTLTKRILLLTKRKPCIVRSDY